MNLSAIPLLSIYSNERAYIHTKKRYIRIIIVVLLKNSKKLEKVSTSIIRRLDKYTGIFHDLILISNKKKLLIMQICKNVQNIMLSKISLTHLISYVNPYIYI